MALMVCLRMCSACRVLGFRVEGLKSRVASGLAASAPVSLDIYGHSLVHSAVVLLDGPIRPQPQAPQKSSHPH